MYGTINRNQSGLPPTAGPHWFVALQPEETTQIPELMGMIKDLKEQGLAGTSLERARLDKQLFGCHVGGIKLFDWSIYTYCFPNQNTAAGLYEILR